MEIYWKDYLSVSHQPAKFGHRYCSREDILVLVFNMGRSLSIKVTILPSLVAIDTLVVEI